MKHTKRLLCVLLSIVLVAACFVTGAVAKVAYGDVTHDGEINAADALAVLKFAVDKQEFTPEEEKLGEVSADKVINAQDALLILQYAVNKIDRFPIEDLAGVTLGGTITVVDALAGVSAYETLVSPVEIDEDFNTLTQINVSYSANYDLDLDCYLAYVYGRNPSPGSASFPNQWRAKKTTYHNDTKIGIMVAFNRDNGEYVAIDNNGSTRDVQTEKDGTLIKHSQMTHPIYYMVPTKEYMEYKWDAVNSYLEAGGVEVVALEEPELWNRSGYSEGFKAEYEAYYGEAWQDPETSAEAMWKNQYFKAYINKAGVEYLAKKIKEKYPDVVVIIAAHSNYGYTVHGISTGMAMYASIPEVDGFIGQTWSDEADYSMYYNGKKGSDVFLNSLYAYNSYSESLGRSQSLYLLQDPASDIAGSLEEELMFNRWKQTVVSAMMQNDTTSFQSTIWPQRAFDIASPEYKTRQLNINKMYEEFDTLVGANYAGTPGVALATSDSVGWHISNETLTSSKVDQHPRAGYTGVFCALESRGIPVDSVCLDQPDDILREQLEQTNLLILPYDTMKPMSPTANKVIAQWVKEGGRILYLAGDDVYSHMSYEWWGEKNITPFADLMNELGLGDVAITTGVASGSTVQATDAAVAQTYVLKDKYLANVNTFSGANLNTILTMDGKTLAFTAAVGEGQAVITGLPSLYYALAETGDDLVCWLTQKALEGSDTPYTEADAYVSLRGNYFAYYSPTKENKTAADKVYIDLFSPTLDLVPGGSTLPMQKAQLYYDVTEFLKDSKPRIGFIGATEMSKREEKATTTSCSIAYPSNSEAAVIFFGNGKYPKWAEAYQGTTERKIETIWNPELGALVVKIPNRNAAKNIDITVEWTTQPTEEFPAK